MQNWSWGAAEGHGRVGKNRHDTVKFLPDIGASPS